MGEGRGNVRQASEPAGPGGPPGIQHVGTGLAAMFAPHRHPSGRSRSHRPEGDGAALSWNGVPRPQFCDGLVRLASVALDEEFAASALDGEEFAASALEDGRLAARALEVGVEAIPPTVVEIRLDVWLQSLTATAGCKVMVVA